LDIAKGLMSEGHEVSIVTGFPNYPSGKLYDGYRLGMFRREKISDINVIRTFEFPYHGKRASGRIVNYLSFMLSAPLAAFFLRNFDMIYVWHPPLTIGVSAWVLGKVLRAPVVYDIQDIWPETAVISGLMKSGKMTRLLHRLEKFVYRRMDHILVVTPGARENIEKKGAARSKISILPQWADGSLFGNETSKEVSAMRLRENWENRFVVLFAGNVGLVQGLDVMLEAAKKVRGTKCLFAIIGDGNEKGRLQILVEENGLENNVRFYERVTPAEVSKYFAAADVLYVPLKGSALNEFVIPGKTYAYLAAGKPILMATGGAGNRLIQRAGAGLAVEADNVDSLVAGLMKFMALDDSAMKEMGAKAKVQFCKHFRMENTIPMYNKLFERIVDGSKTGSSVEPFVHEFFREG